MFVTSDTGSSEIWAMKANGNDQRQLTHTGGSMTFPNYSPDGTRIVFSGTLSGSPSTDPEARRVGGTRIVSSGTPGSARQAIFIIHADGSGFTQLTDGTSNDSLPAWSPNGSKIAFESDRSGVPQVWVMSPNGTRAVQLTYDLAPKTQRPDWSPDGRRIVFAAGSPATGGPDIFVMNSDGTGLRQLTSRQGLNFAPRWSPDGTKIAFVTNRDNPPAARTVYVMNAGGTDQHAVRPGGLQLAPSWQAAAG